MNTNVKPRPMPKPTPTTQPFWDGAKRGKLMLQYDPDTQKFQFWPRMCSVRTGRRNLEWRESSGKGQLYSYTVTYVPTAGFEDRVPYLVGLVELDEGVRIIGNVTGVEPDEVQVGMRVRVDWEKLSDDIAYFAFVPDEAGAT